MAITIEPKLPVIAGFVAIPDDNNNLPKITPAEVLSAISGTYILTFGTTDKRDFVVFPNYDSNSKAAEDYYEEVRELARAKL